MLCMVPLGIGEMIGGPIIGFITDKYNAKKAVFAILIMVVMTSGTSVAFLVVNEFNYLAYMMPLMWGVLDSAINTHIILMLGFEFDTNSEPFSVFTLIEALSVFVFSVLNTWIDTH